MVLISIIVSVSSMYKSHLYPSIEISLRILSLFPRNANLRLLIEEAIQRGELSLTDDVIISNNASSMGGSQVFLDPNTTLKVEDLLKSIIIASANDVAVTKKQSQVIGEETN